MGNTQGQQEEETPSSAPPPPAPQAIIWTRRNIILFVIVVVQGAIILAYMIFVALLFFSPELRQRVIPPDSGAMLAPLLGIWGYFFERYGCYSPLPPAPVPIPGQGGAEHWAHRRAPLQFPFSRVVGEKARDRGGQSHCMLRLYNQTYPLKES